MENQSLRCNQIGEEKKKTKEKEQACCRIGETVGGFGKAESNKSH